MWAGHVTGDDPGSAGPDGTAESLSPVRLLVKRKSQSDIICEPFVEKGADFHPENCGSV